MIAFFPEKLVYSVHMAVAAGRGVGKPVFESKASAKPRLAKSENVPPTADFYLKLPPYLEIISQ